MFLLRRRGSEATNGFRTYTDKIKITFFVFYIFNKDTLRYKYDIDGIWKTLRKNEKKKLNNVLAISGPLTPTWLDYNMVTWDGIRCFCLWQRFLFIL